MTRQRKGGRFANEIRGVSRLGEMDSWTLPLFLSHIRVVESGCWEWTAGRNAKNYGKFTTHGREVQPHRLAYEHWVAVIPDGLVLDHLCRNPPCVNPDHLEIITHRINILRGIGPCANNARKTHCAKGHEYDESNTIHRRTGGRACKACKQESNISYQVSRRARIKREGQTSG